MSNDEARTKRARSICASIEGENKGYQYLDGSRDSYPMMEAVLVAMQEAEQANHACVYVDNAYIGDEAHNPLAAELLANARLIAAAPDLLAVAMGWESLHAEMVAAGGDRAELPAEHVERFAAIQLRLMDETRAAISKATSRQPGGER